MDEESEWARDLFLAFHCSADHFNAQLLRLIHKSDPDNLEKIRLGFPVAVQIHEEWNNTPNEREFFRKFQINLRGEEENRLFDRLFGMTYEDKIIYCFKKLREENKGTSPAEVAQEMARWGWLGQMNAELDVERLMRYLQDKGRL